MPNTTSQLNPNTKINKNRQFGLMLSSLFLFLFVLKSFALMNYPFVFLYLLFSIIFGLTAWIRPRLLSPLLRRWIQLGEVMGKFVSPIVLGTIFFLLITPVALISRFFGRDELRLNKVDMKSYWIKRTPPGPARNSFKNQF